MSTKSETKVMTKGQIAEFLKKTVATVAGKDIDLAKRVDYTLTHLKKATKADLEGLMTDVQSLFAMPIAENQPKILEEDESENEEVIVDSEEEEKPKKKLKKSTKAAKSNKSKSQGVVESESVSSKGMLPCAKIFPKEIDHEDLGKLIAVPDKYHTYKEVFKALEDGKTLYFACYWTARHIKEYDYAVTRNVPAPKKFPHDLDLLVACIPCEKIDRLWCMSQYTEALFMFEGDAFEPIEDEDIHTGEKFSIRVSHGMEYEIYVPEDEA